jgi:hypothetical protein
MSNKTVLLSKNFKLSEFTEQNGLNYELTDIQIITNISALVNVVLQPASDWLKMPISINSGYRTKTHNSEVGGANNSQHLYGQAADISCVNLQQLFIYMQDHLKFDQLVFETDKHTRNKWIHVSYNSTGRNRQQVINNLIKQ